ncbi:MAG: UDP-N-acetylglucosamine--N-acetylmuramyl-(pentapeptide) pyrophosphoryl-undecaprenol N-acetylglucosamine transferase [Anaerolineae bacterium]
MRLWIAGGGTGGHVYPALAVVEALASASSPPGPLSRRGALGEGVGVRWIGSRGGVEERLVTRAGLAFDAIPAGGVHGLGPLRAALNVLKLLAGTLRAIGLARAFRPQALLVTGGFVSVPAALACWLRRTPIVVYLPDVEPGLAVKFVSRWATRVAVSVDDSKQFLPSRKVVVTGYPTRSDLLRADRSEAVRHFGLDPDRKTLLVFGGSAGARSLNRAVGSILEWLLARYQVIHISGSSDAAEMRARREALAGEAKSRYHLFEYLHDDRGWALAAADVAVSRSGASALGEFPLFGLASILVPYPYAWRYQRVNADYLASRGAAIRLNDEDLTDGLQPAIDRLMSDDAARAQMQRQARSLARPDAAARLADLLVGLAGAERI